MATPKSTNPSYEWCFVLVNHFLFNCFSGMPALPRASFQNMKCNNWWRIFSNSSLINGTTGLSVWNTVRYGISIPAMKGKKCILMGIWVSVMINWYFIWLNWWSRRFANPFPMWYNLEKVFPNSNYFLSHRFVFNPVCQTKFMDRRLFWWGEIR